MKNKRVLLFFLVIVLCVVIISPVNAAKKTKLTKAIITNIDNFTLTATKNNRTYTINAQTAILQNAKRKRATIDQYFVGDQIDVKGTENSGTITARTIKDRSLKPGDLTRRSVGAENIKNDAISDLNFISNGVITEDKLKTGTITNSSLADSANISYSKLNLVGQITGSDLASNLTISTTGDITANNLTVNGNTTLGDNSTDTLTLNASALSVPNNLNVDSGTLYVNASNNRVGIGTTGPSQKLHVSGGYTAFENGVHIGSSGAPWTQLVITADSAHSLLSLEANNLTNSYARMDFYTDSSVVWNAGAYNTATAQGFDIQNNSGGWNSRFFIANAGNVGLGGEKTPGSKLSVKGGVSVGSTTAYSQKAAPTGGMIVEGNVGIGTTAPAESLDINGQIRLEINSSQPYACDASHNGAIAATNKYTTCMCKNGSGWVLTSDGTTGCTWD